MSNPRTLAAFQALFRAIGVTPADVKLRWGSGAVGDLSASLIVRLPEHVMDLRADPQDGQTGEVVFLVLLAAFRRRLQRGLVLADIEARGGPPS